ncbi:MAG: aminotransferase class I/II-fold pyridoxal phosphate-dependent enzyme [Lachnospiraceae bacterium]|nr:aminotransferase class I/II-fold pyridoxal phosphate-dependent enzyme [Lachnospiraceae bacterium]
MNLHGGYFPGDITGYLDFSANIAPFGMPEKVKEAAKEAVGLSHRYPDPHCLRLREAIAEKYASGPENVICGNGAADLIYRIAGALRENLKRALIIEPAFTEYERALKLYGAEVSHFVQENGNIADCLEHIRNSDIDIVFIANPSNPKGILTDRNDLEKLSAVCAEKRIILVIDECFMEFVEDCREYSMSGCLNEYTLVLNAFTKLYAMPGLRLGYIIGKNPVLLKKIDEERQPWVISTPAYEAGLAALKLSDEEYRLPLVKYIAARREFLRKELKEIGFDEISGTANYLFFRSEITDLKERMLSGKIIIRDCSDYYGLCKGCYRIAVLGDEENRRLIDAFKLSILQSADQIVQV